MPFFYGYPFIFRAPKDEWIPVEKGHQLHELISNSVLEIILDAGHLVIEEQPKILIDKILHFLKQPTN